MQASAMILQALLRDVRPLVAVFGERRASRHFRDHQPSAERRRLTAERRIGDAGHRRQEDRIGQRNFTDGDALHIQTSRRKITLRLLAGIATVSTSAKLWRLAKAATSSRSLIPQVGFCARKLPSNSWLLGAVWRPL